jgi:ATP-dependent Lon protease
MVFVGNTDHTVQYMLKHSNLFDALPKDYCDTAFLDRMHAYLPGWEVQKLRNDMFSSDYGFIVDYLAEILKDLRREDYTNEYKRFFDLSSTITTRDKDSISKTFAGLFKVIYPHGEVSKEDARELLEFAIESRKRVKLQLQKMDETFLTDKVEFSYTDRETAKIHVVETLEGIQYADAEISVPLLKKEKPSTTLVSEEIEAISSKKPEPQIVTPRKVLKEGQVVLRDNQTGISYEKLFGDYLEGATEITITDPYIRLPYQFRNLMEFIELVTKKVDLENEVKIHLVTVNSEEYIEGFKEKLEQLEYALESTGISFNYEFIEGIHDRSILLDSGWKIVLGRGLDIWQKTSGWYDLSEFLQEKRQCKGCEVTYLKLKKD